MIHKNKYYVFYDGECGFCNFWVQWILNNDKKDKFLFASLQGNFGQNFLKERNLETNNFNTIYLWKPEAYYLKKSSAIIKIAENLGGKYRLSTLIRIIPRFIRDFVYDAISNRRKKLMNASCLLPNVLQRKKIIN